MDKIKGLKLLAILCMVLPLLVSCGQKGDLFLPKSAVIMSDIG